MSFADDINKFVVKCKDNSHKVVRKTLFDIGKSLVERSPVGDPSTWKNDPPPGYSGGHFRANWQLGMGSIPSGILDLKDKNGTATIKAIQDSIPKEAAGFAYFIANNLPYAQALEDGHSGQAPFGMVALTQVEFQNIINSAVKELQ